MSRSEGKRLAPDAIRLRFERAWLEQEKGAIHVWWGEVKSKAIEAGTDTKDKWNERFATQRLKVNLNIPWVNE